MDGYLFSFIPFHMVSLYSPPRQIVYQSYKLALHFYLCVYDVKMHLAVESMRDFLKSEPKWKRGLTVH